MKTTTYSSLLCTLIFFVISCTGFPIEDNTTDYDFIQSLLIENRTTFITAEEAINVAKLFEIRQKTDTKASSLRKVANVQTITNADGQPVMYAINYQNDKGFIIVSASRKYQPILAEEDRSSFSEHRHASGVDIWIQEQTALINCAEALSEKDESIRHYINEWKDYEKHPVSGIATKSGDILSLRASSIAAWEAQGYTCLDLCDGCPNYLPESIYEDWLDLAEQTANPEYNYYTNSIILYLREDSTSQTGPILQTTWGQDQPYNVYMPVVNGLNARAGCSIVAMGQIMKHYAWPNTYNWSAMADHYALTDSALLVSGLFHDLGICAKTNYYSPSGSTTNIDSLLIAITGNQYPYHYYATIQNPHNGGTTVSEINNGRPIFMQGQDNSMTPPKAHAWVCDGRKTCTSSKTYILKVLSPDEPLSYISAGSPYNSYESSSYLHMNWGEDGEANGWFYQDNVHYSGPFYWTSVEFNFSAFRKDIIGITPNYVY